MFALFNLARGLFGLIVGLMLLIVPTMFHPTVEGPPIEPPQKVSTTTIESPKSTFSTTTTAATTSNKIKASVPALPTPKKVATSTPKTPVHVPPPPLTLSDAISAIAAQNIDRTATTTANDLVRSALVNILCVVDGDQFNSTSGSGIIIDPRGVILTNAHVAQLLLLQNYTRDNYVTCYARTGSPAVSRYILEPLFISPEWIKFNAHQFKSLEPTGNGEYDYALLRIASPVGNQVLPQSYPFVNVLLETVKLNTDVLVAGYAAGFLDSETILKNLYASSATGHIKDVMTYGTSSIDVYSVSGNVVTQKGSSGGAVTDKNGLLVGLIVTATLDPDTSNRTLNAISSPYIFSALASERGKSIQNLLSGNLVEETNIFKTVYEPKLTQMLVDVIEGR